MPSGHPVGTQATRYRRKSNQTDETRAAPMDHPRPRLSVRLSQAREPGRGWTVDPLVTPCRMLPNPPQCIPRARPTTLEGGRTSLIEPDHRAPGSPPKREGEGLGFFRRNTPNSDKSHLRYASPELGPLGRRPSAPLPCAPSGPGGAYGAARFQQAWPRSALGLLPRPSAQLPHLLASLDQGPPDRPSWPIRASVCGSTAQPWRENPGLPDVGKTGHDLALRLGRSRVRRTREK